MSILNYFSKDENKRANFIFNFIAPIYGKIAKKISTNYNKPIDIIDKEIGITNKKVLDIGCGTGAWAIKFMEKNAKEIVGIDFAKKMIKHAKKVFPEINFIVCDAEKLEKIPNNSFDIVTASYVLHGVKKEKRELMLKQMKRVSKEYLVFHDFYGRVTNFAKFLEFIEQSDMPYFKSNFENELKNQFKNVRVFDLGRGGGIYICQI